MGALLHDLIFDYTLRTVAVGSAVLGMVSGALGCFAVLRRQSLMGDAISHAALPGIALAFLLARSKEPILLILGAGVAGWIGMLGVMSVVRHSRVKEDSALGIVLSVFFGFGLLLLTFIQRLPDANQAGLDKFLFGQAAALLERDVVTLAILGGLALLGMILFWKEFKLLSFDPDFAASLGFPTSRVDVLLTSLLVTAIVIGLQTVGVVLMSAMIVAPASAARQWTDRLGRMVVLAGAFGAVAGVSGSVISSLVPRMPTGPVIVLCASAIVVVSLLFAPRRGLVAGWVRRQRDRRVLRLEVALTDLYALSLQHPDRSHAHAMESLRAMRPGWGGLRRSLDALEDQGWVRHTSDGWSLTPTGASEARRKIIAVGGQEES